ncbi:MAG: NAD(P)H-hydrate epimerase [Chloroflexi bacterium]|nr:NAD(P)H-hydrate epimerase [Chloroflexota bacterium]
MASIELPNLSVEQMHEVDRLMREDYQIEVLQIMENAGHKLALLAKRLLDDDVVDRAIVVLAGRDSKGGGGLVAARHLLEWGAWVQVLLTHPLADYTGIPAQQLAVLQAMDAPLAWAEEGWELPPADLVIDALIAHDTRSDRHGKVRDLIQLANSSVAPILSLEAPSGLDLVTGQLNTPHIHAAATLTLALPKAGLLSEPGVSAIGQLYVADISVPPQLYARLGLDVPPLFDRDSITPIAVIEGKAVIEAP